MADIQKEKQTALDFVDANKDWLSFGMASFDILNDRIEFVFFIQVNCIRLIIANHRFMGWNADDVELINI